jgi:hypothetical protein
LSVGAKWQRWLSSAASTNNTASIISTWCIYCGTKVSLVMLLWKVLQQGWNGASMKTMASRENFTCCYRENPILLETKIVLECFVAAMASIFR